MESPTAFTQGYQSSPNSYHSPTNMYQSPPQFQTQQSCDISNPDSALVLNTTEIYQSPPKTFQSPTHSYKVNTQSSRSSSVCDSNAALPTTDEEWAKVADAVERRRVQNRNAQRKYRKKCKRRAEELERRKAAGAFTPVSQVSSSNNGSRVSTPQRQSRASVPPSVRHQNTMGSYRSASMPPVREYTPLVAQEEAAFQFRQRNGSMCSESGLQQNDVMYPWLSTEVLVGNHPMDQSFGDNVGMNQPMCNDSAQFPDMFPISSVPAAMYTSDYYTSSDGMSSGSHSRSSSTGSHADRASSLGPEVSGRTMLHIAASKGNKDMLRLLLERGGDANVKDSYGFTPLHLAVENGHSEVASVLLESGANIYATTEQPCLNDNIYDNTWAVPEQQWVKQEAS